MSFEINPYAPPLSESGPEDDVETPTEAPFRDPSILAKATVVMTGIAFAGGLASAGCAYLTIGLLRRIVAGEALPPKVVADNDLLVAIAMLLRLLAECVASLLFLIWTYRVSKNLASLGADQRFSPGWAVGSYFVPVFNFFRPVQALAEIWRGSDPARLIAGAKPERQLPLAIWWMLYLITCVFGAALSAAEQSANASPATQLSQWEYTLVGILGLMAPQQLLTIWIVRRLTRNQLARREILSPESAERNVMKAATPG